jgi:hypothetical protein
LVSVLEESTACKACTVEVLDELFAHFIKYCEAEIMSLQCNYLMEKINVRKWHAELKKATRLHAQ